MQFDLLLILLYSCSIHTIFKIIQSAISEGIIYGNEACFFYAWMSGMDMD